MDSVSLKQLQAERTRLEQARENLRLNVVAHDGAIQALDQLILMAKSQKSSSADLIAENGGAAPNTKRDAMAKERPGASQEE